MSETIYNSEFKKKKKKRQSVFLPIISSFYKNANSSRTHDNEKCKIVIDQTVSDTLKETLLLGIPNWSSLQHKNGQN